MDHEPRATHGDGLGELTGSFDDFLVGHANGRRIEEDLSGQIERQDFPLASHLAAEVQVDFESE